MQTLTMPLTAAKLMCKAILPHISTDDITPSLTYALVEGNYAFATDRYSVGRYDITNLADSGTDEPMLLPRKAVQFLASVGASVLLWDEAFYHARIEWMPHQHGRRVQVALVYDINDADEFHLVRVFEGGKDVKFPPVARLFEDLKAGAERRFITVGGQLDKFVAFSRSSRHNLRVTTTRGGRADKLSPVLIEVGPRFKGLLQPTGDIGSSFGNDIIDFASDQDGDTNLPGDTGEQPKGN